MSKRYAIFLHRNVTDEYSPLFECIYTTEVLILLLFLSVVPFPIWIALNAQPLHRNLRYAFVLAAIQGVFGTISRLALLYSQMINITLERLIATLFWLWYEKQGRSTLLVLILGLAILESFAVWSACPLEETNSEHNGLCCRHWSFGKRVVILVCTLNIFRDTRYYSATIYENYAESEKESISINIHSAERIK
ncbi:hypothetical protein PMAYCL1PPCAC_17365 [Pristionchus mayeri]|uniref:G protein-coupled receptor n=1 Tax=Pristionchus mayeri TaxID=1317129 RepID=A0AAN5CMR1_9BILA|nr:hypothetical protein PMAYCL1PPCAC_17365 [Pristionchus mayeri]